jgi:hypothetical protein
MQKKGYIQNIYGNTYTLKVWFSVQGTVALFGYLVILLLTVWL